MFTMYVKLCLHRGELWTNDQTENPTSHFSMLSRSCQLHKIHNALWFWPHLILGTWWRISAGAFDRGISPELDLAPGCCMVAPQGRLNADQVSLNHSKESSLSSSATCERTVFPHLGYSHFPIPLFLELPCTVVVYVTVHPHATNKQSGVFLCSFMYLLSMGADGHFSISPVVSPLRKACFTSWQDVKLNTKDGPGPCQLIYEDLNDTKAHHTMLLTWV